MYTKQVSLLVQGRLTGNNAPQVTKLTHVVSKTFTLYTQFYVQFGLRTIYVIVYWHKDTDVHPEYWLFDSKGKENISTVGIDLVLKYHVTVLQYNSFVYVTCSIYTQSPGSFQVWNEYFPYRHLHMTYMSRS